MRSLESVAAAVEGGDEGAVVDVDDEALRLLPVEHAEGLGTAHGVDPSTYSKTISNYIPATSCYLGKFGNH